MRDGRIRCDGPPAAVIRADTLPYIFGIGFLVHEIAGRRLADGYAEAEMIKACTRKAAFAPGGKRDPSKSAGAEGRVNRAADRRWWRQRMRRACRRRQST